MVARAARMQAKASPQRMRRASIGSGLAWTVYSRPSTELYAVGSHAIAISMQPHPHQGYTAKVVDGGLLPTRGECKKRRAQRSCFTCYLGLHRASLSFL